MIEASPQILSRRLEDNIEAKIDGLARLGFKNPLKMIETLPQIFGLSVEENIKPKVDGLARLGFENPLKMIEASPQIFGLSIEENIKPKVDGLARLGFKNSKKMIERFPSILGMSLEENIEPKIDGLTRLEFKNPIKMIESFPMFLGMSLEENIQPTIQELENNWSITEQQIETTPRLIGASLERIRPLRILLARLNIFPDQLSILLRYNCIKSLSESDILGQLRQHGYLDEASQKLAIAQPTNWPWIFQKHQSCEGAIVKNDGAERN